MDAAKIVLWEVDAQADFMLPGGKLYVPGAEKIIPNIKRLVDAALAKRAPIVSSADAHSEDDPEFANFPPHCVAGTPGARIIPEGMAPMFRVLANSAGAVLPRDFGGIQQIVLQKQALDVFTNPRAGELVERLGTSVEYIVCGVVTEYCVACAARGLLRRGRRVSVVTDAIETLKPEDGRRTLDELVEVGARLTTTAAAVADL